MKKRPPLAEMHQNLVFDIEDVETNDESMPHENKSKIKYEKNRLVEIPISELEIDKNIIDTYADDSLEELGD